MTVDLFAGLPVSALARAVEWYERLLGAPPSMYAAQLRRKLEDDPARPRHLITSPGLSYTLEA